MATKMAAVGERDAVLAFQAVGLRVEPVETPEEASHAVNALAKEGYSIILVTECTAQGIEETISAEENHAHPGDNTHTRCGRHQVARAAMKAIGGKGRGRGTY